ncbi:DUF1361 domain-containing protein [Sporolactobacillus vineae]|uniref:DUF1361 domain-containing protein n=1 Tax=Sporolactobacillus vineae TaxID=444463 RepID=UPI001EE65113|nr:DUF1361 domain-containing protein [Sporolactobacillus vineae]
MPLKPVRHIRSTENAVLCFFVLYLVFSLPVAVITQRMINLMMIWNCFLALLPLVFAWQFRPPSAGSWRYNLPLGMLWLLFFPNAPYMITDFAHLSAVSFFTDAASGARVVMTENPAAWLSLIQIGIGVLFGNLSGLLSMALIHDHLTRRLGTKHAHLAIFLICLISGYAMFIGRFLRFNSWDIIHPSRLLTQLASHVNLYAIGYSLLFAVYILLSYWLFLTFTDLGSHHGTRFRS